MLDCKDRLEAYLREKQVPFEIRHHPRAITAQEVAASEHTPGKMVVKVVMVLADGELAILAMPAPYQADLDRVGEALGATEVRLAHEEEFGPAFPDCEVGAMPPFGNLYGMKVYVADALGEEDEIAFNAGTHRELIQLAYHDFVRRVKPHVLRAGR
jgi:Ala-tRNA(Pro) deacylase